MDAMQVILMLMVRILRYAISYSITITHALLWLFDYSIHYLLFICYQDSETSVCVNFGDWRDVAQLQS